MKVVEIFPFRSGRKVPSTFILSVFLDSVMTRPEKGLFLLPQGVELSVVSNTRRYISLTDLSSVRCTDRSMTEVHHIPVGQRGGSIELRVREEGWKIVLFMDSLRILDIVP